MQNRPEVMIIDTDRSRTRALRRTLLQGRESLKVVEVSEPTAAQDAIFNQRPVLVLLHTSFPYACEDGTGLMELIRQDFRATRTGVMLVLPISGSLLYRSGPQEGIEVLDQADDLITTDFTSDMVRAVVFDYLDRRLAAEPVAEAERAIAKPGYAFVSKRV